MKSMLVPSPLSQLTTNGAKVSNFILNIASFHLVEHFSNEEVLLQYL